MSLLGSISGSMNGDRMHVLCVRVCTRIITNKVLAMLYYFMSLTSTKPDRVLQQDLVIFELF